MKQTVKRIIQALALALILSLTVCIAASAESADVESEENVFQELFQTVKAHSAELLSALAFAGSAILTFTYKRGMMPTLKRGIGAVGGAVAEIKENQNKASELQDKFTEEMKSRLAGLGELIANVEALIEKSETVLESLGEGFSEREKILAVANEQVSLLYDVFMFSSMPEYQKDAVGHRVEAMRKLIAESEAGSNEERKA